MSLAFFALAAFVAQPAHAALKVAVVELAAGTGTPPFTQDFTDSGAFGGTTPKGAICTAADAGSTDTSAANYRAAIGAMDGTREGALALRVGFSTPSTLGSYAVRNDRAYVHVDSSGNVDGYADGSLITNGVRLTWGDQSVGETIRCVIFGGDIEFGVNAWTPASGTSEQSVTHNLTAAPDLIIGFGVGEAANTDANGNVKASIGFYSSSAQVGMGHWVASGVSTTTTSNRLSSTTAVNEQVSSGNFNGTGTISNVQATTFGFTNSVSSTDMILFVSIRSTSGTVYKKTGTFTAKTTTGTQADVSGMSGAPQVLLTVGTQLTTLDSASTAGPSEGWSFGIAVKNSGSGSTQYGTISTILDDNTTASGTTQHNAWSNTKSLYLLTTAGATDLGASVNSWDSGGVTHNYATVSGSAYQFAYAALGAEVASVPTFTSAPAIGTRTSSTIPINYTSDTTGTMYGARLTDGSSTPTCDQLEAQTATGGVQYASDAATATVADTLTFSSITDGTVTDGYFCIEDGSGNDSAVASIANMYKLPAWTTTPSVTAQDDNDYTVTKVLDGTGSCTAVACVVNSTPPTAAQILAGDCTGDVDAIASATDASCEAGTLTLGGSLTRYVHDIYVAGTYGSQNSAVTTLADECLDPASGQTFVGGCPNGLTSVDGDSPITTFNASATPDITTGDVPSCDTTTAPGGCALTWTADGNYEYPGSCGSSRQLFDCRFYDASVGNLHADTMNVCVNNSPPRVALAPDPYIFIKDRAFDDITLSSFFEDDDDATLTLTTSDTGTGTGVNKRPAGTTLTAGLWEDAGAGATSADASTGGFAVTATDSCGASVQLEIEWGVYAEVTVPDLVNQTLEDAGDLLAAVNLSVGTITSASHPTIPLGSVISQTPAASATADPFTEVDVVVSTGVAARRRIYPSFFLETRLGL